MTEWTIAADKMMDVLSVLDLVPARPGIPSSVFVALTEKNGKMEMALSSDVAGEVTITGKGTMGLKKSVYVDRRLFFPFINTAKTYKSDKPFVFSKPGKQMLVTQGRRKATFDPIVGSSGYGDLNGAASGIVLPLDKKLNELITVACTCATSDPTVPELNCIFTARNKTGLDVYASNQLVVLKAVQKAKGKYPERLPFPLFLVPLLSNDHVREVRFKDKEVVVHFDCGFIWQGVSVKASKGFPLKTMDKLLTDGKEWAELFRLQTHRLGAVTRRFSEYLTAIRRQDWLMSVKAETGDKQVLLEVSIPQGIFREKVIVEEAIKQDLDIQWPLDILLPVFEHWAKNKEAVLTVRGDKKTPYLLSGAGLNLVVTRKKA